VEDRKKKKLHRAWLDTRVSECEGILSPVSMVLWSTKLGTIIIIIPNFTFFLCFHNETQYSIFYPNHYSFRQPFIIVYHCYHNFHNYYNNYTLIPLNLRHACSKFLSLVTTKFNFIFLIYCFWNDATRESDYLVDHLLPRTFQWQNSMKNIGLYIFSWMEPLLGYQIVSHRRYKIMKISEFLFFYFFIFCDRVNYNPQKNAVKCLCALLLSSKFLCTICTKIESLFKWHYILLKMGLKYLILQNT